MTPAVDPPQRILVINVSRIGDTLLVTPALRALASAWPQARISFFGHPRRVEIMQMSQSSWKRGRERKTSAGRRRPASWSVLGKVKRTTWPA